MPIDYTLISQNRLPRAPGPMQPMELEAKQLTLNEAKRQDQIGQMDLQERLNTLKDLHEVRAAMKQSQDPDEIVTNIRALGTPTALKIATEMQDALQKHQLDQLKIAKEQLDATGSVMGVLSDENASDSERQAFY